MIWQTMKKEDLILELGRYEKKVRDQWEEMKRLRKELKEFQDGVSELNLATSIAFARVVEKYGAYGYGGRFITVPAGEADIDSIINISAEKIGDLNFIVIKDKAE